MPNHSKNYQKVAIVGLGAQAKAIASNLKDSGRSVTIVLRKESLSHNKAKELGFPTLHLNSKELADFDLVYMLASDNQHQKILREMAQVLKAGTTIVYAHGFSVVKFDLATEFSKFNHWLLAPKAIASEVRQNYLNKLPLAAIYSTQYEQRAEALSDLKKLAKDMGITVGPFPASFLQETQADLFSEQTILCALLPYASLKAYQKLREKGIPKELAFLECWHEMKLIATALVENGPTAFFNLISTNAFLGANQAVPLFFDSKFDDKMETVANQIWDGSFLKKLDELQLQEKEKRNAVLDFWKKEELNDTYLEFKDLLYKK